MQPCSVNLLPNVLKTAGDGGDNNTTKPFRNASGITRESIFFFLHLNP